MEILEFDFHISSLKLEFLDTVYFWIYFTFVICFMVVYLSTEIATTV